MKVPESENYRYLMGVKDVWSDGWVLTWYEWVSWVKSDRLVSEVRRNENEPPRAKFDHEARLAVLEHLASRYHPLSLGL